MAAATVDHGLRPQSAEEAGFVATVCAERGIAHAILKPATPISGSMQASARTARYALLQQWCDSHAINWLMTAHHADDQLETMIMRANRSSGVGGMAGIRARQGRLLRPLLGWRRTELEQLVQAQGLTAIDDPSNRDDRYDRARIRPAVRACTLVDPLAAAAVAGHLAEADEALEWTVDRLAAERLSEGADGVTLEVADLPPELLRRLLLRALETVEQAPARLRGHQLDSAIQALATGQQAMLGMVLIRADRRNAQQWRLRHAPPRRTRQG